MNHEKQSNRDGERDPEIKKLATNVASSKPGEPDLSDEAYRKLNAELQAHGTIIAQQGKAFVAAVDAAIPKLAEMRAFLSQRGAKRIKVSDSKLCNWTHWLNAYLRDHKIEYSPQQIRRKINAYEQKHGLNQDNRARSKPFFLGEGLRKAKAGEAVRSLLREMAIAASKGQPLDDLLSRCCSMGIVNESDLQSAREKGAGASGSEKTPEHPVSHAVMLDPNLFKPGNVALLHEALRVEMSEHMRNTFNLPNEAEKMEAFWSFCIGIGKEFAGLNLSDFGFELKPRMDRPPLMHLPAPNDPCLFNQ